MKAPVKAGRESRMKEPHKKGVANHLDPESCADVGNPVGEALTGAHAGQPSSSEITSPGVPTLYGEGEGHIQDDVTCEPLWNATGSIPGDPEIGAPGYSWADRGGGRSSFL